MIWHASSGKPFRGGKVASVQNVAELRDIHLPKPPGIWPLAPGWYLLILLLVLGSYLGYCRHRRLRPRREALKLLADYERQYARQVSPALISANISELLKRVALVYFPRQDVASLHGMGWIDFLSRTSKKIDFHAVSGLLLDLPYRNENCASVDLQALFRSARAWIKQRGVPCSN